MGGVPGVTPDLPAVLGLPAVSGLTTVAQYASIPAASPPLVARLRNAMDFSAALPLSLACDHAVQSPNAAGPVASGPTGVALVVAVVLTSLADLSGWAAGTTPTAWWAKSCAASGRTPAAAATAMPPKPTAPAARAAPSLAPRSVLNIAGLLRRWCAGSDVANVSRYASNARA